ncbi:hypothetical protein NOJ05_03980 [Neorhizobium galegae]|uniref:hypothetical protein n=1 Tax=Neorhizobium galegae TaxID=399 RepID=UPI0021052F56|nr:hypothetical protein [Neorhizobium galegae]MCQ1776350.1 hypothetical protein [Neorhizobium galegae]MCQ1798998.1 hypothetical protein [Neorhizobium galegae]
MRTSEIVESGEARSVPDAPRHPYSQHLKSAIPTPNGRGVLTSGSTASQQARIASSVDRRDRAAVALTANYPFPEAK